MLVLWKRVSLCLCVPEFLESCLISMVTGIQNEMCGPQPLLDAFVVSDSSRRSYLWGSLNVILNSPIFFAFTASEIGNQELESSKKVFLDKAGDPPPAGVQAHTKGRMMRVSRGFGGGSILLVVQFDSVVDVTWDRG